MLLITQLAATEAVALNVFVTCPANAGASASSRTAKAVAANMWVVLRDMIRLLPSGLEVHRRGDGIRVAADGDVLACEGDAVHVEGARRLAGGCGRHEGRGGGPRGGGAGPVDVVAEVVGGRSQAHRARAAR